VGKKSQVRNRRTFLRALAAAPVIPALESASAQDAPPAPESAKVDALAEVVRLRFGEYLAENDMPEIKRGIERMLRNADAINRITLTNADEPDFLFHPQDL
jgi:hypothetical protein